MGEDALISLASIVVLGIGAQWLAWRLRLPSILLLLLAGFLAGPATNLVDPDHLMGETLFPVVSISVGIILFEGGLTLRIGELKDVRQVVFRLITVGMVVTWLVASLGAYFIIGLDFKLSVLIGAVFVVSGPTVVLPLLNFVRPRGQISPILKWEGILIDPVGATLAVLIFEIILTEQLEGTTIAIVFSGLARSLTVGAAAGTLAAWIMIQLFKRYWVPEYLQNPFAVMLIVGTFTVSNELQAESGLLATTLMGFILANQKQVPVKHITQFKEDLGVLLLSSLFVILAARLELESLSNIGPRALLFLALLIVVGRPLAVYLSTVGSRLTWQERVFMSWLAPRGIVAVSVASLFALELMDAGYPGADRLVPLTFLIVVGTVAIYGLSASSLAKRLQLAQPAPQGVLIVGAHPWAQTIARALQDAGTQVLLVDTNWKHVSSAKLDGLPAVYASVLSEEMTNSDMDLSAIGKLIALTRNDEVNSLACLRFAELFGRSNVFQLPLPDGDQGRKGINLEQHGRCLFKTGVTYDYLTERFHQEAVVKKVKLTREFDYPAFQQYYGSSALPLFVTDEDGNLTILTTDNGVKPRAGHTMISLIDMNVKSAFDRNPRAS